MVHVRGMVHEGWYMVQESKLWYDTHGLAHQHFRFYEKVKKWIDSWIDSKDSSFFRDAIRKLPERWEKVVISIRQYFD